MMQYKSLGLILLALIAASGRADGLAAGDCAIDPSKPDCGIQAAIDALGPQGGEVRLPAGHIVLERALMLRSNVTLRGAGTGQTILTLKNRHQQVRYEQVTPNQIRLLAQAPGLAVNTTLHLRPEPRPVKLHASQVSTHLVTAVAGDLVTLDTPIVGRHLAKGTAGFGQAALLRKTCGKGDDRLEVCDPTLFRAGAAVVVGTADGNANESLSFVKAIDGNTLVLERPIRLEHAVGDTKGYRPAAWALFPIITAEDVTRVTVADLALEHPFAPDAQPTLDRYTISPIHLFNATDSLLENVTVSHSIADGISLQDGARVTARKCRVTGSRGNGFHPGTGLTDSIFEDCSAQDSGSGLYFCWNNVGHIIRRCQFIANGTGISGLGNPSDRNNTIEECLFLNNLEVAIQINGGKKSGNAIRRNIFRDNSAAAAGRHPAILLNAQVEDARCYIIEANTFENTTSPARQSAGIVEQHGSYKGAPTAADENIIRGNTFSGMAVADVIVAGDHTMVDQPGSRIQRGPVAAPDTGGD